MKKIYIPFSLFLFLPILLQSTTRKVNINPILHITSITSTQKCVRIKVGAEQTNRYFPLLQGKRIAILSNQTGMVGKEHLVDLLKRNHFDIVGIFSPEHGFRGTADAGEHVANSVDKKTGIPIWSLYGVEGEKPSSEKMNRFDVLVFDLQDVGTRFYTYYITMARMMDACAISGKKMIVLDRPNPNGFYVDGPLLDMKYKSGGMVADSGGPRHDAR